MFENQISLFAKGVFEDEDGEPVLVVQGGVDYLRFSQSIRTRREEFVL